jgi:DNA repair photolyase
MNGKPVFTVPAKTVINFKSKFDKKKLCDGITFTAGSACVYDCAFCYVPDMQRKQREWFEKNGVVYPPAGHSGVVIRTRDAVEIARNQIISKPMEFRMAKKTIFASPKVDVAGNMELVRETVAICRVILELTNWDIRLLSKSNLLPKVAESLLEWGESMMYGDMKDRVIYGVSTGTLDDNLAAAFEQGTAKVSKRIQSLHWLQDNGFRTFGMICPSLPMASREDYVRFAQSMASTIRADRCEHVWAEVINARGESFTKTHSALEAAGFHTEAFELERATRNNENWEEYARHTYYALSNYIPLDKLRFMQYTTYKTADWWAKQEGVVLL